MVINPPPLVPQTKNKINPLILMMIFAVFLGLIASLGIWQYLTKTQERVKKLTVTRAVVIAAKQLPAGTKLSESDLAIKQLPAQVVPRDYPASVALLKNRVVKTTIQPQEVVTESRLVKEGAAGGLPYVIPANYRAITVKVNEVSGVAGFINPGDHVDILSIVKGGEGKTFSKTILQDVLVLAAGDKILDPNNVVHLKPKVVNQVTVALSPKDSEKLALASESGQLHLVLRPNAEHSLSSTYGTSQEDLYGSFIGQTTESSAYSQQPSITPAHATPGIPKDTVEIIYGSQRTYYYY